MSKYEPLARFLRDRPDDVWDARFCDVERVLGFSLPRSAFQYNAWWANQEPGHTQTRGWRDAGWQTSRIDLEGKQVRFSREQRRSAATAAAPTPSMDELWQKAERITGIKDRDALLEAALTALIRRESARKLSGIGGSLPDFGVPARERPAW